MKNKKFTIVAILFMGFLIFSSAYAYILASIDTENITNISVNTTAAPNFTAYSSKDLALNIVSEDFENPSNVAVASSDGELKVTFASSVENVEVKCSYDIKIVWSTTNQYIAPSVTLPYEDYNYEISIAGERNTENDTTGHLYLDKNLDEINLTDLSWNGANETVGRSAKLVESAEIFSKSLTPTVTTWDFNIYFYCLPVSQSNLLGKNFGLYLTVDNIIC